MKEKSTNINNKNNEKIKSKSKVNSRKKHNTQFSRKGVATFTLIILCLITILILLTISFINKNSISKVSSNLSSNIGQSIVDIEKSTKIDFYQSASSELLSSLQKFDYVAEPVLTTRVCGVRVPKWIVYSRANKSGMTTQFTIYDFTILKDNVLGVKVSDYIETSNLIGFSEENLIDNMNISPYISTILADGSKQLIFKYYYRDSASKNDTAIQLSVELDANGTVVNISEINVDFISNILSIEEKTSDTE